MLHRTSAIVSLNAQHSNGFCTICADAHLRVVHFNFQVDNQRFACSGGMLPRFSMQHLLKNVARGRSGVKGAVFSGSKSRKSSAYLHLKK